MSFAADLDDVTLSASLPMKRLCKSLMDISCGRVLLLDSSVALRWIYPAIGGPVATKAVPSLDQLTNVRAALGIVLSLRRTGLEISLEHASQQLAITPDELNQIEHGEVDVSLSFLYQIASLLDAGPASILRGAQTIAKWSDEKPSLEAFQAMQREAKAEDAPRVRRRLKKRYK